MSKNRWVLPRNKRILTPIPKIIAVFSGVSLNQQWKGQRGLQISIEDALEAAELKKVGDRRDKGGSGARTYLAQCKALGLTFVQPSNVFSTASKMIFAPLHGTAIPICFLTDSLLPWKK